MFLLFSSGDEEEVSCLVKAFSMVKELLVSVDQQVRTGFQYQHVGAFKHLLSAEEHGQLIIPTCRRKMTLVPFDRWRIWRRPSG